MPTGIRIENLPEWSRYIALKYKYVMTPDSYHAWCGIISGKFEPIGSQPQRPDGTTEHPDGGTAPTKCPPRTALWMWQDF